MQPITDFFSSANIGELLLNGALTLLGAIVIFYVGRWVARIVQNVLERILRKRAVDEVLVDFLGTIAYALVVVIAVVAALDTLGIPATSLVAVVGAAGLAIGLALKDSLSNFAAGVMLVLFRPFTKGDFIDAGGVAGTVDEVFLVSTRLLTPDNKLISIPNGVIWSGTITNFSAKDTRRVDMVIGVGYDDDLKVAADVLKKILDEHELILDDPAPVVTIADLGASSVDFAVRPWVNSGDYWGVRADVLEKAKGQLEAAGCSIPFPQTDVHLHRIGGEGGSAGDGQE